MGLRTPEEYVESLRQQHPEVYARGQRIENVADHPLFSSTLACWGRWVFSAAHDPELAETMVAQSDLIGEPCHVFWHMATDARRARPEPVGRAAAVRAVAALGLREHRPRRAPGAAHRLPRRRRGERHGLPPACPRVREALPARADHDRRRRHRRQGRSQQAPRRPGRPGPLPARGRPFERRHRRARRQGPHVRLGRLERARDHPDAGDAGGGQRLRRRRSRSRWTRPASSSSAGASAASTRTSSRHRCRATTT